MAPIRSKRQARKLRWYAEEQRIWKNQNRDRETTLPYPAPLVPDEMPLAVEFYLRALRSLVRYAEACDA